MSVTVLLHHVLPPRPRQSLHALGGLGLLLWVCPPVAWILLAFALKLLWDTGAYERSQLVAPTLGWLALILWGPETVRFSQFEPWFLLPFNLQRQVHLWFLLKKKPSAVPRDGLLILAWCFSPLFLTATVEWFEDTLDGFREKSVIIHAQKAGTWLLLALISGFVAEFLRHAFVYPVLDLTAAEVASIPLLWALILVGPAFFLSMMGIFYLARFFQCLCGLNPVFPIFGPVYKARSPVHFWLNWNIPTVHTLREFLFLPLLRKQGIQVGVFLAGLAFWWILQGWWHANHFWAGLHLAVISLQIGYIRAKASGALWARWFHRNVPAGWKILCTMVFILASAAVWPANRPDLLWEGLQRAWVYWGF